MHTLLCSCQVDDYCAQVIFEELVASLNIMTYRPIARQRLGKPIHTGANARSNRTYIVRQRISKHASLTIEVVLSAWSVQSGYRKCSAA
jgi:hypothetical protein